MKSRRYIRAAVIGLAGMMCFTLCGCTGRQTEEQAESGQIKEEQTKEEPPERDSAEEGRAEDSADTSLEGEIQELGEQNFVLNKAFVEEDDEGEAMIMSVVENEDDMELITVFYDENTVFSKRTIWDGGARYKDAESSPEELEAGAMVKMQGAYEDGEFHAAGIQIIDVIL